MVWIRTGGRGNRERRTYRREVEFKGLYWMWGDEGKVENGKVETRSRITP